MNQNTETYHFPPTQKILANQSELVLSTNSLHLGLPVILHPANKHLANLHFQNCSFIYPTVLEKINFFNFEREIHHILLWYYRNISKQKKLYDFSTVSSFYQQIICKNIKKTVFRTKASIGCFFFFLPHAFESQKFSVSHLKFFFSDDSKLLHSHGRKQEFNLPIALYFGILHGENKKKKDLHHNS